MNLFWFQFYSYIKANRTVKGKQNYNPKEIFTRKFEEINIKVNI